MEAERLVQALAVAWNGVHLYPDPGTVPSFTHAVESIGEFATSSLVLTVTVDGFEAGDQPVPTEHSAADRLVRALFSKRVESLAVMAPPGAEDLIRFFTLLTEDAGSSDLEVDLGAGIDFATRVQLAGIDAIRVRCHELLDERDEDEEPEDAIERDPDVRALFEPDSTRTIADRLAAAGSPHAAGEHFVEIFHRTYEQVADGDPAGLERVVQTFVDAFFHLDHQYRTAVFEAILEMRDEMPFRNLLDQFSVDELAELSGNVKDAALPLLVEYARVVSEMQGRDPGLVERVMGEEDQPDARGAVAGTVSAHLAEFLTGDAAKTGAVDSLVDEIAALAQAPRMGWVVLEDLFGIEQRPERQRRLLRIWVAKLGAALRSRAFDDAHAWLAVLNGSDIDPRYLDDAFGQVASSEVLAILTEAAPEDRALRDELLEELSRRSGKRVLEQLATEEDPGRRRMLIDIVTEIARVDIRSILPGLADPRWYVVRNLAIALGKSGRKTAGEPLARLAQHEDHRVRIEALRALIPCLGNAAVDHLVAALADEHVRVRAAATDLLDVVDESLVIPALRSALRNETLPVDVRVAVIEALGRQADGEARSLLEQVAASRAGLSGSARALRAAARDALRSSHA